MKVLLYLTKKTLKLWDPGILAFFVSNTFIYKPILIKVSVTNIIKTQIFHKMKYDLKGQIRPLLCQNHSKTYDLKCNFYVSKEICAFFYLKTSWPNYTTLIYVFMDNFFLEMTLCGGFSQQKKTFSRAEGNNSIWTF